MSRVALCVWRLICFRKTKCVCYHDRKNSGRMMILEECHGNGNLVWLRAGDDCFEGKYMSKNWKQFEKQKSREILGESHHFRLLRFINFMQLAFTARKYSSFLFNCPVTLGKWSVVAEQEGACPSPGQHAWVWPAASHLLSRSVVYLVAHSGRERSCCCPLRV